jgi:hypothetical protein
MEVGAMTQTKRSRATDYAAYLVMRSIICLVQLMPWGRALALARGLA